MGYDLHITRAEEWSDNTDSEITPQEWLALIEADPELTLMNMSGYPYFARWSGPSQYDDPWFDFSGGNIYTKNPDEPMIAKMIEMAARLGAKVQGDDGELYET
jgi:hypothetical protein